MSSDTNSQSGQLSEIVGHVNSANNVLVTVSKSPSVDQLAACIALTVALNKQGKHATAVFSGKVPSTIEFLEPEKTIETNTNSLRDFIISLDKSKADKLRYKVEDDFVKIFITPYRTSIDEKDLAFSQGDFNVDLVITLGVHERTHLDEAIMAHGRILHDATIVSMTTDTIGEVGTVNWLDTASSSLCEMTSDLIVELDKSLLDEQIATALLTGMVAETDRFGNEKAHPHTMSVSGVLMAAGASPQLISTKLEEATPDEPADEIPAVVEDEFLPLEEITQETKPEPEPEPEPPKSPDGMIKIEHTGEPDLIVEPAQADKHSNSQDSTVEPEPPLVPEFEPEAEVNEEPAPTPEAAAEEEPQPSLPEPPAIPDLPPSQLEVSDKMVLEPPQLGGQLTANSVPEYEQYTPTTDPLSTKPSRSPLLGAQRHRAATPTSEEVAAEESSEDKPGEEKAAEDEPAATPAVAVEAPAAIMPPATSESAPAEPAAAPTPEESSAKEPATPEQTLSDLERAVDSPHLQEPLDVTPPKMPELVQPSQLEPGALDEQPVSSPPQPPQVQAPVPPPPPVDEARSAVENLLNSSDTYHPEPISALNAMPVNLDLGHDPEPTSASPTAPNSGLVFEDNDQSMNNSSDNAPPTGPPPQVPPPLMPPGL